MHSSLLGLVIAAILASAAPRTPAGEPHPQVQRDLQAAEAQARRQYAAEKAHCRTAAADESACVLEARARFRAARDGR